jgi:2-C-methyl-D-erythritol 2,4-cyclodiphosphate synthase
MTVEFPQIRVGQGFDIHRFTDDPARVLVLGGEAFPGERGLEGHSDADVIAHACADALLGAAGLGDIGMHFPDTDPQWRGVDSLVLLRHVVSLLAADEWQAVNIDCAVVCERPKLAPARDAMQRRLTEAVGAPVSVKGNRAEQLGSLGRGEGIVCFATALIRQRDEGST